MRRDFAKPLKTGGVRKLGNMAVTVTKEEMSKFLNAWESMRAPHAPVVLRAASQVTPSNQLISTDFSE